jgi:hypothetical protein
MGAEEIQSGKAGVVATVQYGTVLSGFIEGSTDAKRLPSIDIRLVKIKACNTNSGNIYLGGAGVTKPADTDDQTSGIELIGGDETGWLPIDNLNQLYIICDNAGDDLTYLALN